MAAALGVRTLQETKLWQKLQARIAVEGELAKSLSANLPQICDEASNRAKRFAGLHPQYTLHDETHFLRVTQLMGYLIPDTVTLNSLELALLILAAFFHDQGMVLEDAEFTALDYNPQFKLFKNNWIIDHPNYREISQRAIDKRLSKSERKKCHDLEIELNAALFTDFVRITHGTRSAEFVNLQYRRDKRLDAFGLNLASHLARLCISHTISVDELGSQLKLAYDESVGPLTINMVYLAVTLRLADLLDFDVERTPDELFRTIHFTSDVSLIEWAKHRAVEGWVVTPEQIRFTVRCSHPAYQRAVLRFMDYIDGELTNIHAALRMFPAAFSRYELPLPEKVDRTRIQAKDDAYTYHDLEFTLSRDEIVKLLMTENLYHSPSLCVRELLQNSLDALRHRRALLQRDERVSWEDGRILMEHTLDVSGREVLRCTDNGIGMDEEIVARFLVRAGRSYYRSPEFEQERASLAAANADFDPCARFGIGFMSCFMLGEHIKITTRRHYGSSKPPGRPIIVEIHGLSGLVVIRPGKSDQPIGTAVEIIGRVKPTYLDEWADKVNLLDVVDGYALATEFPIDARCSIPEIAGELTVPTAICKITTQLEDRGLRQIRTYEQPFSVIDPRLRGTIRTSVLLDENGNLARSNSEAYWFQQKQHGPGLMIQKEEKDVHFNHRDNVVCLDGILVCGNPGRVLESNHLGAWASQLYLGHDSCILDVRGAIKPSLDPSRTPPDGVRRRADETWLRLNSLVDRAHGLLWEQILTDFGDLGTVEAFWEYMMFQQVPPAKLRNEAIWSKLRFPCKQLDGSRHWKFLKEIREVWFENEVAAGFFLTDGGMVCGTEALLEWHGSNNSKYFPSFVEQIVIPMGNLTLAGNRLSLEFRTPEENDGTPWERIWKREFGGWTYCLPYNGKLQEILSAYGPVNTLNWRHPLTQLVLELRYVSEKSEFQKFLCSLARCLADNDTLSILLDPDYKVHPKDRWRRYIGSTFLSVDWNQISSELRPPYKVWLPDSRIVELGKAEFERWVSA